MGMSASQARALGLHARLNNLEYQGQQINQERTILSQQCTALYNSLLSMTVPTPPSTSDYTTIQYKGVDGATKFTLGNIKPSGKAYSVEMKFTKNGDGIDKNYSSSVVGRPEKDITVKKFKGSEMGRTTAKAAGGVNENTPEGTEFMRLADKASLKDGDEVWTLANGTFTKLKYSADMTGSVYVKDKVQHAKTDDKGNITEPANYTSKDYLFSGETETSAKRDKNQTYYINDGGTWRIATDSDFGKDGEFKDYEYAIATDKDGENIPNPEFDESGITVGANRCYTLDQAVKEQRISEEDKLRYEEAIKNSGYKPEDMYIFFQGTNPQFVLKQTTENALLANSNTKYAETFSFTNTTYTKTEVKDGCELEFDVQGRITSVSIPSEDGKSMRKLTLEAEKVTDEAAYQDAYNQYEYAQYEYDKKQQEINAKTEVIQQEDRNLELKLQRLDNERSQITTEIEAVDKVINDNIESSYKTFNG